MRFRALAFGLLLVLVATPAAAENARELLMNAAFTPSNKATALGRIDQAIRKGVCSGRLRSVIVAR